MIEKVLALKDKIEEETAYSFFFDIRADGDGEVVFQYTIMLGWDVKKDENLWFNACDRKTNIDGFYQAVSDAEKWVDDNPPPTVEKEVVDESTKRA